ncbi:hypothetical protein HID58_005112 [Brassica napus]|uniref:KIB1-4 beta-propeller domain-containing protein n=1 Tax=Brassica napus TaxID=3708 RepID=A0ABQ8E7M6_BRANA|nr:hypothetical protein HID58_005112 [Brassica napus]
MALFLHRLVKPALVRRSSSVSLLISNGFSTTSLRQTPPCSIIGAKPCLPLEFFYRSGLGTLIIANANVADMSCLVRLKKKVPVDLVHNDPDDTMVTIGASHGWCVGFENLPPKLPTPLMDSCCMSQHLVESTPTGETFLVKQYRKTAKIVEGVAQMKTQFLMVFKLDDEGNAVYTQDMGDLTMFLSMSEPFCVPSTSFPGLLPNYVYILDFDETAMVSLVDGFPLVATNGKTDAPYYIPPQNILD